MAMAMQPGAEAPKAPPAEDGGADAQGILDSIGSGIEQLGALLQKLGDEQDTKQLDNLKGAYEGFVQYLNQPEGQEAEPKGPMPSMGGPKGQPMPPGM